MTRESIQKEVKLANPSNWSATLQERLGYIDGNNLYEYVRGNPSSGLDPAGTQTISLSPTSTPSPVTPGLGPIWTPDPRSGRAGAGVSPTSGGLSQLGIMAGILSQTVGWQHQVANQIANAGLCPDSQMEVWQFFQAGVQSGNVYAAEIAKWRWPWEPTPTAPRFDFATSSNVAMNHIRAKIIELKARDAATGCQSCQAQAEEDVRQQCRSQCHKDYDRDASFCNRLPWPESRDCHRAIEHELQYCIRRCNGGWYGPTPPVPKW